MINEILNFIGENFLELLALSLLLYWVYKRYIKSNDLRKTMKITSPQDHSETGDVTKLKQEVKK